MINHFKKYWVLHATAAAALVAALAQVTHDYLTAHPHFTMSGLLGALVWAAITFFMKSPRE